MDKRLIDIIDSMDAISLEECEKVKFLKRLDLKYLATIDQLIHILGTARGYYQVMTVGSIPYQEYKTTYFDTPDNLFYTNHHNGRNNRIKIRKREYVSTGERFLEIKVKTLNGNTTKKRITVTSALNALPNEEESQFITKRTGMELNDLTPAIDTGFTRITLVSKSFDERVTIDLGLTCRDASGRQFVSDNLCIIEVKCNKTSGYTPIRQILKDNDVRTGGFSKYCIGRATLDESLKQNNFKRKIKILKTNYL